MKQFFLLLLTTLTLSCCNKDDDPPTNPVDQLPPATQVGANKVGCLVNGEVFLPRGSNPLGPPIVTCYYQYVNNGFEFGLGFSNNSNGSRGVTMLTNKLEFIEGQTYILKEQQPVSSAYASFSKGLIFSVTDIINQGQLKITKLDQTNAIISGTFWFDAKNNAGEIVKVTEGRFDMKYSQ